MGFGFVEVDVEIEKGGDEMDFGNLLRRRLELQYQLLNAAFIFKNDIESVDEHIKEINQNIKILKMVINDYEKTTSNK